MEHRFAPFAFVVASVSAVHTGSVVAAAGAFDVASAFAAAGFYKLAAAESLSVLTISGQIRGSNRSRPALSCSAISVVTSSSQRVPDKQR